MDTEEQDEFEAGSDAGDGDTNSDEEENDIVVLSDAEGNETEFEFVAKVEVDGVEYALLTPNAVEESEENTEIFIFKYEQDEDGGETFSDVPDEAIFAKVRAQAEELFAELAEGEEENDPNN